MPDAAVPAQAVAPQKAHSTLVGGSSAGRILQCPGSWKAIRDLPPSIETPSVWAEEGTFGHEIMDSLMRLRMKGVPDLHGYARTMLGQHVYDRTVTQEHIDTLVEPALEQLSALEQLYGGRFKVLAVESRVRFPGVISAFGTCDIIMANDDFIMVPDWKFGSGVPVRAVYSDENGDLLNPQLMFYLAGAIHTLPKFFKVKRRPVIAIMQPRIADGLTHTEVSYEEVEAFIEDIHEAVAVALDRNPPIQKGEHCRWCPAKIACPLWTGPMLDLTALGHVRQKETDAHAPKVTAYGLYLARAKSLVDAAVMFKTEIDKQLQNFLEQGGTVPGWRLKLKSHNRQWAPSEQVVPALEALGFTEDEIWQRKLQTFTATDATAKRKGVKVPDSLRVAPPHNGECTICGDDDPAPAVDRKLAVSQFQTALQQLKASVDQL